MVMESCTIKVRIHSALRIESDINAVVVFRLVTFRPFRSEVILAKVKSSGEDAIRCELWFCILTTALPV